jgi:hypothetical protein
MTIRDFSCCLRAYPMDIVFPATQALIGVGPGERVEP